MRRSTSLAGVFFGCTLFLVMVMARGAELRETIERFGSIWRYLATTGCAVSTTRNIAEHRD
jgi:hypothetical protein